MPSRLELLARGLTATPRHSAKALRSLPTHAAEPRPRADAAQRARVNVVSGAARRVAELLPGTGDDLVVERLLAPKTSLNRRISAHRRCAFTTISLTEVKRIKNHFGVTVNDVVVAITAGALREWLLVHDELPTDPLLAMIPVSVRLPEEFGTFGNRVSMMTVPIPTNEHEPAERVRVAHEAMDQAKARHATTPRMLMQEANEGIPPMMLARTAQTLLNVAAAAC